MEKSYISAAILILLVASQSCKKDTAPNKPAAVTASKELIREIKWTTTGAKADLLYNADSTLKTINYMGSGSSYGVDYLYTNKSIRAMDLGNSLYRFEYFYDNAGRICNIKRQNDGENSYTQDLEFSYNSNGTVAVLKYYQINGSGKRLIYTNTYAYNAALELVEVISTAQNGSKFLFTIASYSDPIKFDPLWFIGIDLNEDYMIFNYPVLNSMKRLPATVKRAKITNGHAVTEQIVTISSTTKNGRLEKQNTLINYPNRPGSAINYETLYAY